MYAVLKEIFRVLLPGEVCHLGIREFCGQIPDILVVILPGLGGKFREIIPVAVHGQDHQHGRDGELPADLKEEPQVVVLRGETVAVYSVGIAALFLRLAGGSLPVAFLIHKKFVLLMLIPVGLRLGAQGSPIRLFFAELPLSREEMPAN